MKKVLTVLTVGLVILLGQVPQAQAINREWSAVLGFLGGYMVANGGLGPRPYYSEPVVVQQPVIVEQPVVTGHYECVPQQVWVPGWWSYVGGPYGCGRQVWHPGYYQVEYVQVWVSDWPAPPHHMRHGWR